MPGVLSVLTRGRPRGLGVPGDLCQPLGGGTWSWHPQGHLARGGCHGGGTEAGRGGLTVTGDVLALGALGGAGAVGGAQGGCVCGCNWAPAPPPPGTDHRRHSPCSQLSPRRLSLPACRQRGGQGPPVQPRLCSCGPSHSPAPESGLGVLAGTQRDTGRCKGSGLAGTHHSSSPSAMSPEGCVPWVLCVPSWVPCSLCAVCVPPSQSLGAVSCPAAPHGCCLPWVLCKSLECQVCPLGVMCSPWVPCSLGALSPTPPACPWVLCVSPRCHFPHTVCPWVPYPSLQPPVGSVSPGCPVCPLSAVYALQVPSPLGAMCVHPGCLVCPLGATHVPWMPCPLHSPPRSMSPEAGLLPVPTGDTAGCPGAPAAPVAGGRGAALAGAVQAAPTAGAALAAFMVTTPGHPGVPLHIRALTAGGGHTAPVLLQSACGDRVGFGDTVWDSDHLRAHVCVCIGVQMCTHTCSCRTCRHPQPCLGGTLTPPAPHHLGAHGLQVQAGLTVGAAAAGLAVLVLPAGQTLLQVPAVPRAAVGTGHQHRAGRAGPPCRARPSASQ